MAISALLWPFLLSGPPPEMRGDSVLRGGHPVMFFELPLEVAPVFYAEADENLLDGQSGGFQQHLRLFHSKGVEVLRRARAGLCLEQVMKA